MHKTFIYNTLLIIIILFAAGIRSINIGKFGLYGDEKYSLMVVNGISWEGATQHEIFKRTENGALATKYFTPKQFWNALSFSDIDEALIRTDNGNSSSYYALLYIWKSVFGQSDAALRAMGVLFDCLTIGLIFIFCVNILQLPTVGLLAGFFAAIEPFMIAYSHQVRNYPMGIFLTLLSVFLFFKILKNETEKKENKWYFIIYGITILLGILSHFYVVLFIFCQFILLVFRYLYKKQVFRNFLLTYIISFSFLALWFIIGSGRKTISTFKEKDLIFKNMAESLGAKSTDISYVKVANFENIYNKISPIFIDNFIIANDIIWKYIGKFNLIICILLTGILLFFYDLSKEEIWQKKNITYLLLAVCISIFFYFLFSINALYYNYLALIFLFLVVLVRFYFQNKNWKFHYLEFSLITVFLPAIITVFAAFRAGHTANIYQKYLSFGLPISFILVAIGLHQIGKQKSYLAYGILVVFGLFLLNIAKVDKLILNDNYSKYTIVENRAPNPYITIATKIQKLYQPGDTVIYSNAGHTPFDKFDPQMKKDYISVVDAQLTNIYLPKTAQIIQRVDENEANKVYLYQLKSNNKLLVFDFEGRKYRY